MNVDAQDANGITALVSAVHVSRDGNTEVGFKLLDKGADISICPDDKIWQFMPVHVATTKAPKYVEWLLSVYGIDSRLIYKYKKTEPVEVSIVLALCIIIFCMFPQ